MKKLVYSLMILSFAACGSDQVGEDDSRDYNWTSENCDICPTNWGNSEEGNCAHCDNTHYGDNCQNIKGVMTDKHGNTYLTVKIGEQEWMAENMRDETDVDCIKDPSNTDWTDDYGCLYTWEDAKKVCPNGWKLPRKDDFDNLLTYVTNNRTASSNFLALIKKSTAWTKYSNKGLDEFGFSALPSSYSDNSAYFWSATFPTISSGNADAYHLSMRGSNPYISDYREKLDGLSVRCIKN